MSYPFIAQRVFHTPLLAAPAKVAGFITGLGPTLLGCGSIDVSGFEGEAITKPSNKPFASLLDDRVDDEINSGQVSAFRVVEGIAVIPITGSLVHRGSYVGSFSGTTSYEGIAAQVRAALTHSGVRAIALEIDCHGGEVAGCFALADLIRKAREEKPVHAFVCDNAHSAAYAIASQSSRIVVPRTGSAGSIGVICVHGDFSQQLEERGLNLTIIAAGKHKADGNPYEPLPESVRASLQKEMETLRAIFADTVGAGRGAKLTAAGALETEAACLIGQAAVEAGLADEVANPKDAFEQFAAQFSWRRRPSGIQATKEGPITMGTKPEDQAADDAPRTTPAGNVDTAPTPDDAETDSAPQQSAPGGQPAAPSAASEQAAPVAGAGQEDERKRIAAILNSPEAEGRQELAKSLAFESNMSAEEAVKHLKAAGKEQKTGSLADRMERAEDSSLDIPSGGQAESGGLAAKAARRFGPKK